MREVVLPRAVFASPVGVHKYASPRLFSVLPLSLIPARMAHVSVQVVEWCSLEREREIRTGHPWPTSLRLCHWACRPSTPPRTGLHWPT